MTDKDKLDDIKKSLDDNKKSLDDIKKSLDDNKNNGLITKIWGPAMWESIHCVAFGYPIEPTKEQKENYKNFFINLMNILPCKFCRDSYKDFITKEEETILTDDDFKNRDSLTRFVFKIHNRVNKKLGINYDLKYDDFVKKYESYRAKCIPNEKGCNMPLNMKADSFNMSEIKHAPIITINIYEGMKKYAELRGVKFNDVILKIFEIKDRFDDTWRKRDKKCRQIIRKMRNDGIPSVEKDGKYKNMPTIDELHLISLLSTNICCEELAIIIENIKKELDL